MNRPYQYSNPMPFFSDVWGELDPRSGNIVDPKASAPTSRPPREALSVAATALIKQIAQTKISLQHTARQLPHIVNRLALLWNDHVALTKYINDLILDDRVNRDGFDFAVINELADVKTIRCAQLEAHARYR